jgi:hypothetical protein
MFFLKISTHLTLATATAALAFAGCNASSNVPTTGPVQAIVYPTSYQQDASIAVPGVPSSSGTFSFDIGFVDNAAGQYYLADRNTAGVDVINTATLQYVSTAGKGQFTGFGTPGPGGSPSTNGGPNGVLSIGGGILFAGDGNSTLKVLNANSGAVLATVPAVNPYAGPPLPGICAPNSAGVNAAGIPSTGAGNQRVDEMDYDPTDNLVLAINGAACPAFGTFFSASAPYAAVGTVVFPTANNGGEQPRWDPAQGKFLVAIPSTTANPGGEIDVIDPKSFAISNVLPLQNCQPNGAALGKNENLFLGCSVGNLQLVSATSGAVLATVNGQGGADEVYYNAASDRFYAADIAPPGPGTLVITDSKGNLITTESTTGVAHSVAADQMDHVYVPEKSSIVVYGH